MKNEILDDYAASGAGVPRPSPRTALTATTRH